MDITLNVLGVNTRPSQRFDASGSPIPDDYSPLSSTFSPGQRDELAILGVNLEGATARMAIVDDLGDGGGVLTSREDTPFLDSNVSSWGIPITFNAHICHLKGEDHFAHIQQRLIKRRTTQTCRAAHGRVKKFDIDGLLVRFC